MNTSMKQVSLNAEIGTLERTVPAHMLILALEACAQQGYECRSDIPTHLLRSVMAPFAGLDGLSVARLSKRSEELSDALLKRLNADDALDALYTAAMFSLKLADEGLIRDKQAQYVLCSLLLITDVQEAEKDKFGDYSVYRANETRWRSKAGDMLLQANLNGLFLNRDRVCN